MEIIDTVLAQITEHQGASSSVFLAQALASACSRHYSVSLLDASVKLDQNSMSLFGDGRENGQKRTLSMRPVRLRP